MPHILHHHYPPPPPLLSAESVPPIPPRCRSRPSSRQQYQQPQTILTTRAQQNHPNHNFFRLDDLPSPDREWQLLENIGDGTYGEVFRVSSSRGNNSDIDRHFDLGTQYSKSGF